MRNDLWLKNKMESLWQQHFSDVPRINDVQILFGRKARTRLGSIKQHRGYCSSPSRTIPDFSTRSKNKNDSLITINGHFMDETVPEFMVDAVIAHELCHYAHGFSSPLPQLSKYPHQGGIVDREMANRGFSAILKMQKKWLKDNWNTIVKNPKSEYRNPKKTRKSKFKIIKIFRTFGF